MQTNTAPPLDFVDWVGMAPVYVKTIRSVLKLSCEQLADELRLGTDGARIVRRWEDGTRLVSGPAQLILEHWYDRAILARSISYGN